MRFEIKNIEPMGAVRMTTRGKYVKANAQRYLAYKELIYRDVLRQLNGFYEPYDCSVGMSIKFFMPISASWPKWKKEAAKLGAYCSVKPDIDNLVKGLFDSLNGLIFVDDNRVVTMNACKVYSETPGIEFVVNPIGGLNHGQAKTKAQEKAEQRGKRKAESRASRDISERL